MSNDRYIKTSNLNNEKNVFEGYVKVEVTFDENYSNQRVNQGSQSPVILEPVSSDALPYKNVLKAEELKKFNLERLPQTMILLKKDEASPEQIIKEKGGFHPKKPFADSSSADISSMLHVLTVPGASAKDNGFISCTSSLSTLKNSNKNRGDYLYMVAATGPVVHQSSSLSEKKTSSFIPAHALQEILQEAKRQNTSATEYYNVPGSIDAKDIIAFRKDATVAKEHDHSRSSSPLYIKKDFIKQFPSYLSYILKSFLGKNERVEPMQINLLNALIQESDTKLQATKQNPIYNADMQKQKSEATSVNLTSNKSEEKKEEKYIYYHPEKNGQYAFSNPNSKETIEKHANYWKNRGQEKIVVTKLYIPEDEYHKLQASTFIDQKQMNKILEINEKYKLSSEPVKEKGMAKENKSDYYLSDKDISLLIKENKDNERYKTSTKNRNFFDPSKLTISEEKVEKIIKNTTPSKK